MERIVFWNKRWPTCQSSQSTFICVIFCPVFWLVQALRLPVTLPLLLHMLGTQHWGCLSAGSAPPACRQMLPCKSTFLFFCPVPVPPPTAACSSFQTALSPDATAPWHFPGCSFLTGCPFSLFCGFLCTSSQCHCCRFLVESLITDLLLSRLRGPFPELREMYPNPRHTPHAERGSESAPKKSWVNKFQEDGVIVPSTQTKKWRVMEAWQCVLWVSDDAWAKGQGGRSGILLAVEPGVCLRLRRLELWPPHREAELSWGEEAAWPGGITGRCSWHPGTCGGGGTAIWEEESPPWIDFR